MGYRIRYGPGKPGRWKGNRKLRNAAAAGLLAGVLLLGAVFPAVEQVLSDTLLPEDGTVAVMVRVLSQGGSLREAVVTGCREVLLENSG